ncbi:MAG: beta-ketoacyl-ACP synthase II [Anaerovoracaceae bacterium]
MRRVVVTGFGDVTPVGNDAETSWKNIKNGVNGIDRITHFDTEGQKCVMGAEVKDFEYPDRRAARRLDPTSQFALTAAEEALKMSGIVSGENVDPLRFGVYGGAGIGGVQTLEGQIRKAESRGDVRHVSALMIPMTIANLIAGNIAIKFKAKGPCIGVVTACAAGTQAIGEAFRNIKDGYTDVICAGGSEAAFAPACFAGFGTMKATTRKEDRDRCCIPFDAERDGFVMGEGAGFVVLEELEHAKARGAKIYAEIAGYGSTCDAYHVTMPEPEGEGAASCMRLALEEAGIDAKEIDYINAHGTGTPYNDEFETKAIKMVFGEDTKVPVSSTKSMTGHLLGAAGAIEAIFCIQAIRDGFIPATINYKVPDPKCDLDYVPNEGRNAELSCVLSNSFGFGGHNGSIVIKAPSV